MTCSFLDCYPDKLIRWRYDWEYKRVSGSRCRMITLLITAVVLFFHSLCRPGSLFPLSTPFTGTLTLSESFQSFFLWIKRGGHYTNPLGVDGSHHLTTSWLHLLFWFWRPLLDPALSLQVNYSTFARCCCSQWPLSARRHSHVVRSEWVGNWTASLLKLWSCAHCLWTYCALISYNVDGSRYYLQLPIALIM